MRKYLRLMAIFYKNTLINEMEYRLNFIANVGLSLFWLMWAAISVQIYFLHRSTIGGWTYYQALMVMGLFFAMNGYRQMILTPNLSRISEYVKMGTLDYILTKPVDSQFMVSLRNLGVFNWGDPLIGVGLVAYGVAHLDVWPTVAQVSLFALLVVAAAVLLYSFTLILQTSTLWLVNVERIDPLVSAVLETGRFPVNFYQGWIKAVLTFIIPVAFMTTFPSQALLGTLDWRVAMASVPLAIAAFASSSLFWRFALRFYTGASS